MKVSNQNHKGNISYLDSLEMTNRKQIEVIEKKLIELDCNTKEFAYYHHLQRQLETISYEIIRVKNDMNSIKDFYNW